MFRNAISHSRLVDSLNIQVALLRGLSVPYVVSVRSVSHLITHDKIRYSHLPDPRPRKAIVKKEFLKWGEPVSPSPMLGDMVKAREFEFNVKALNHRGFLRFQKPYKPPANAAERVVEICKACGHPDSEAKLDDAKVKYQILTKANEEFNHAVPNSMLHIICTVDNLVEFYSTEVNTNTPYEELLRNPDLPPNLHVQKEPVRFNAEQFGGQTAFTKSSTLVTGLRSKKKYSGYEAKMTWP